MAPSDRQMRSFFGGVGGLISRLLPMGAGRLRDWSKLSHTELGEAIRAAGWMREEAFLAGPVRRYLEIGSAFAPENPGDAARAMACARGAITWYRRQLIERGQSGEAFDKRVWALAHHHFDDLPNGDFVLAVLRGTATHNTRARNYGPGDDRPFG